jgi:hypothetical protein
VAIPAVPVTGPRCAAVWKRATDARVPGPKSPSAPVGIPTALSHAWRVRTSAPVSPGMSAWVNGTVAAVAPAGAVATASASRTSSADRPRSANVPM